MFSKIWNKIYFIVEFSSRIWNNSWYSQHLWWMNKSRRRKQIKPDNKQHQEAMIYIKLKNWYIFSPTLSIRQLSPDRPWLDSESVKESPAICSCPSVRRLRFFRFSASTFFLMKIDYNMRQTLKLK